MANTYSPANYLGGVNTLLQRRPVGQIDLLATARGAQMADDVGWLNRQRDVANTQIQDWEEARDINRQASEYLVPLTNNYYNAIAAGENPTDFLMNQRDQMMAHSGFLQLDPKVQAKVQQQFANMAKVQLANLLQSGRVPEATRLAEAYGLTSLVPDRAATVQSGNLANIIRGAFPNAALDEQAGTATLYGTTIPMVDLGTGIAQSNGQAIGGLLALKAFRDKQELDARRQELLGGMSGAAATAGNPLEQAFGGAQPQPQPQQQNAQPAPAPAVSSGGNSYYNIDAMNPTAIATESDKLAKVYDTLYKRQFDSKYDQDQTARLMREVYSRMQELRRGFDQVLSGEEAIGRGVTGAMSDAEALRQLGL
ncbi:MAG: hypothetical protein NC080_07365 [Paraprevotella sp.]|nr:hypothetical protein [Paraprevotella sp.]